ncbi:MAG: glycosyltransferase family 4 protein [Actinobacteria bacterium]|nr:glycosyltransferase family 4 protein [Actinomycetota bacterium]
MKILYCVQRYGPEIAGGAEAACRNLARRMVGRGHDVEVLTTRALTYSDWADHFPGGTSELDGLLVHRVGVREPRSEQRFLPLHMRVTTGAPPASAVAMDWLRVLGPDSPAVLTWLDREAGRFDVVVFYTYLYTPAGLGLRVASAHTPTVLHPAAHDEPAWWLDVYRPMLDAADGFSFQTPEEADLVAARGHRPRVDELVGMGVDTEVVGDGDRFRSRIGLGAEPIVLYLGRIDPGKGPDELYRYMATLRDRGRTDATLVVVGEPVVELPEHPGVRYTGFVDEQTKHDALAAATVFAQPSYFESFSLSLCEAWVQRRPALVQRRCAVLAGQARRSRGALPYGSLAEFDAGLARLLRDPHLRAAMGDAGHDYVTSNYSWGVVLDRYERLLERVVAERSAASERSLSSSS